MTPRRLLGPALVAGSLAALATLAACDERQRDPLRVRTASGGTVDLSGTDWQGCFPLPEARSYTQREVHGEEGAVAFVRTAYGSADCTGTAAPEEVGSALAVAEGDVQVGWAGDAPPAGLGASVTATGVVLYFDVGWVPDVYLVDDRDGAHRVLYTGDPTSRPAADQFPTRLLVEGEREQ